MVNTRSSSKKKRGKKAPTRETGASSAVRTQNETTATLATAEDEKKIEDLKLIASLVDWRGTDRDMGKIFYEKFGRALELKVEEFQQDKQQLKECLRRNMGNVKALSTPRKANPTTALLEQITRYKALNFDSDEDMERTVTPVVEAPQNGQAVQTAASSSNTNHVQPQQQLVTAASKSSTVPQPVQDNLQDQQTVTALLASPPNAHPQEDTETAMAVTPEPPAKQQLPPLVDDVVMATPESAAVPTNATYTVVTPIAGQQVQVTSTPVLQAHTPVVPSTPASPMVNMGSFVEMNFTQLKKQKLGTPYNPPPPLADSLKKLAITQAMKKAPPAQLTPLVDMPGTSTKGTPSRAKLDTTMHKKAKLKEIDEKAQQAQKMRDEQIREKAERAKREREERARQVEQNRLKKEQERRENEERQRQQQARIKEFVAEQKKLQLQQAQAASPRSPRVLPSAKKRGTVTRKPVPKNNTNTAPAATAPTTSAAVQPPPKVESESKGKQKKTDQKAAPAIVLETPPIEEMKQPKQPTAPTKLRAGPQIVVDDVRNQQENMPPGHRPPSPQLSPILPDHVDGSEIEEISAYELTKETIFLPPTDENYNVDDLSSGDETDNDEQPRKTVPRWAQPDNLERHVMALRDMVTKEQIERHFGQMRPPNIQEFFQGYQRKYGQRRPSSAVWNSPMSDPTPGEGRYQKQFQTVEEEDTIGKAR